MLNLESFVLVAWLVSKWILQRSWIPKRFFFVVYVFFLSIWNDERKNLSRISQPLMKESLFLFHDILTLCLVAINTSVCKCRCRCSPKYVQFVYVGKKVTQSLCKINWQIRFAVMVSDLAKIFNEKLRRPKFYIDKDTAPSEGWPHTQKSPLSYKNRCFVGRRGKISNTRFLFSWTRSKRWTPICGKFQFKQTKFLQRSVVIPRIKEGTT